MAASFGSQFDPVSVTTFAIGMALAVILLVPRDGGAGRERRLLATALGVFYVGALLSTSSMDAGSRIGPGATLLAAWLVLAGVRHVARPIAPARHARERLVLVVGLGIGIVVALLDSTAARLLSALVLGCAAIAVGKQRAGGTSGPMLVVVLTASALALVLPVAWPGAIAVLARQVLPAWVAIVLLVWITAHQLSLLARAAAMDSLTGLPNRQTFALTLERLIADRQRRGDGVRAVIAVLDLDGFKQVNDRDGHAAGDRALTAAGAELASALRAGDLVARIGGDEFAMLLPHADRAGAEIALARLAGALGAVSPPLTATIGATELGCDDDGAAVLARADSALLDGKAARDGAIRFA